MFKYHSDTNVFGQVPILKRNRQFGRFYRPTYDAVKPIGKLVVESVCQLEGWEKGALSLKKNGERG